MMLKEVKPQNSSTANTAGARKACVSKDAAVQKPV